MWLTAVDAGYAHVAVLTRIENAGAIPLADINPKNSPRVGGRLCWALSSGRFFKAAWC